MTVFADSSERLHYLTDVLTRLQVSAGQVSGTEAEQMFAAVTAWTMLESALNEAGFSGTFAVQLQKASHIVPISKKRLFEIYEKFKAMKHNGAAINEDDAAFIVSAALACVVAIQVAGKLPVATATTVPAVQRQAAIQPPSATFSGSASTKVASLDVVHIPSNWRPPNEESTGVRDPRQQKNEELLLDQVQYALPPFGQTKHWEFDLLPFQKSWSQPPLLPVRGIRLQVWNIPIVQAKNGVLVKVPDTDYFRTYAGGARSPADFSGSHWEHPKLKAAANEGVYLVEYHHAFEVRYLHSDAIHGKAAIEHRASNIARQVGQLGHSDLPLIIDLTERGHSLSPRVEPLDEDLAGKLTIEGMFLREVLRQDDDRVLGSSATGAWGQRQANGTIILGNSASPEPTSKHAVLVLPDWVAENMRETYLQTLIVALPGLCKLVPPRDIWARDPNKRSENS